MTRHQQPPGRHRTPAPRTHEPISKGSIRTHKHDCTRHTFNTQQRSFDLAELDPESTQLDLEIAAACILELPVDTPPPNVTGADTSPHRNSCAQKDSPQSGRPSDLAVLHTRAKAALPRYTFRRELHRSRTQSIIEHEHRESTQPASDHRRCRLTRPHRIHLEERHVNSRLRDAVHVDQPRGPIVVALEPPFQLREVQCLATEYHVPQRQRCRRLTRYSVGLSKLIERGTESD